MSLCAKEKGDSYAPDTCVRRSNRSEPVVCHHSPLFATHRPFHPGVFALAPQHERAKSTQDSQGETTTLPRAGCALLAHRPLQCVRWAKSALCCFVRSHEYPLPCSSSPSAGTDSLENR